MIVRMPPNMPPQTLHRGDVSIHLRAGRVPTLNGSPVDLTGPELAQLHRAGVRPIEATQAPRAFVIKSRVLIGPASPREATFPSTQPLARITPVKVPKSEARS